MDLWTRQAGWPKRPRFATADIDDSAASVRSSSSAARQTPSRIARKTPRDSSEEATFGPISRVEFRCRTEAEDFPAARHLSRRAKRTLVSACAAHGVKFKVLQSMLDSRVAGLGDTTIDGLSSPASNIAPDHVPQIAYRADIDVLRAVAVLSVLCFHWHVPPFFGGFVGVDVFFVISGFLITQAIANEVIAGHFSFVRFYERRVRRIFPALYVVIAVTCVAAWFLLLPPQMTELANSITAVTVFSSNILFWHEADYFDGPAALKPLLHTWSLSVEEQFYLVFPSLMLLIMRRSATSREVRNAATALMVIGIGSFAYNVWQVAAQPSSAFYLSPGRAWEFLVGSILAMRCIPTMKGRTVQFFGATLGIIMILYAAIMFRPHTPFPGVAALLPCLGTAICIWANTGRVPGRIELKLTPVAELYGKISYSLYLWHWPAWVLAKLWLRPEADFAASTKFVMFVLTTAVSCASYKIVEQPFRNRMVFGRTALLASAGAASVLLSVFGVGAWASNGFSSRVSPEIAALAGYAAYSRSVPYRENICFLQPSQRIEEFNVKECLSSRSDMRNVLLIGDSLAAAYLPGIRRATSETEINILQANSAACQPFWDLKQAHLLNCDAMNRLVRGYLHSNPPAVAIISANWRYYSQYLGYERFMALLHATIDDITPNSDVILLGPSIEYEEPLPQLLASAALRGTNLSHPPKWVKPAVFELDNKMRADFATTSKLTYVSLLDANCPDQSCPILVGDIPLEWDSIHLTVAGSEKVIAAAIPQMAMALFGHSRSAKCRMPLRQENGARLRETWKSPTDCGSGLSSLLVGRRPEAIPPEPPPDRRATVGLGRGHP